MFFSFTRFGLLLRRQWLENRKTYLLGMPGLAGLIFIVLAVNSGPRGITLSTQEGVFAGCLFLSSSLFSMTIFSRYNQRTASIQEMMLPVTAFEKLLAAAFYSMVAFPLLYFALVYPVLVLANYVDSEFMGNLQPLYSFTHIWAAPEKTCVYFVLQSAILLIAVSFKRYAVVKGVLIICAFFFGTIHVNEWIAGNLFRSRQPTKLPVAFFKPLPATHAFNGQFTSVDDKVFVFSKASPFTDVELRAKQWPWVVVPSASQQGVFLVIFFLAIPFLWLITWFKLRERQL